MVSDLWRDEPCCCHTKLACVSRDCPNRIVDEYEIVSLDDEPGWLGVFEWARNAGHPSAPCIAKFTEDHREFAVEMCDRLNVRRLSGRTS